jgi:hypothetical protein
MRAAPASAALASGRPGVDLAGCGADEAGEEVDDPTSVTESTEPTERPKPTEPTEPEASRPPNRPTPMTPRSLRLRRRPGRQRSRRTGRPHRERPARGAAHRRHDAGPRRRCVGVGSNAAWDRNGCDLAVPGHRAGLAGRNWWGSAAIPDRHGDLDAGSRAVRRRAGRDAGDDVLQAWLGRCAGQGATKGFDRVEAPTGYTPVRAGAQSGWALLLYGPVPRDPDAAFFEAQSLVRVGDTLSWVVWTQIGEDYNYARGRRRRSGQSRCWWMRWAEHDRWSAPTPSRGPRWEFLPAGRDCQTGGDGTRPLPPPGDARGAMFESLPGGDDPATRADTGARIARLLVSTLTQRSR